MIISPVWTDIPDFGASASKVQPSSPAPYVDGYLPNQQWPAQHANFFLGGLTVNGNLEQDSIDSIITEINNVLSAAAITPSSSVTNQLLQGIQGSSGGLLWRQDCRVATTANITLSGAQTIDGVSVVAGDRVLVKNQSSGENNGVYVCASGAWSRSTDLDTSAEMINSIAVNITAGSTNGTTAWVLVTGGTITLGSTALVFERAPLPGVNIVVPTALPFTSSALNRDTIFAINNLTGNLDITAGANALGVKASVIVFGLSATSTGPTLKTGTDINIPNGFYTLIWDGTAWQTFRTTSEQQIDNLLQNAGIDGTVAANALTISLKQKDGSTDPSTGIGAVFISFRSATLTSGSQILRRVTASLSTVISSGSTAGHVSGKNERIYVYAIDNAGTVELAWSSTNLWSENDLQTTTAEGGAGAADSKTTLYSTTARSNIAIRYLGFLVSNQATAGTWASSMVQKIVGDSYPVSIMSSVTVDTPNGHGSTDTKIRRWTNATTVGTAITRASSAANGDTFTINEDGFYSLAWYDTQAAGGPIFGFSVNSNQLTTNYASITAANATIYARVAVNGIPQVAALPYVYLKVGDVVRCHDDGALDANNATFKFIIGKMG